MDLIYSFGLDSKLLLKSTKEEWASFLITSIDSCQIHLVLVKFVSLTIPIDRIYQITDQYPNSAKGREAAANFFAGKTVIATWGMKKAYRVKSLLFNTSPELEKFTDKDKK